MINVSLISSVKSISSPSKGITSSVDSLESLKISSKESLRSCSVVVKQREHS